MRFPGIKRSVTSSSKASRQDPLKRPLLQSCFLKQRCGRAVWGRYRCDVTQVQMLSVLTPAAPLPCTTSFQKHHTGPNFTASRWRQDHISLRELQAQNGPALHFNAVSFYSRRSLAVTSEGKPGHLCMQGCFFFFSIPPETQDNAAAAKCVVAECLSLRSRSSSHSPPPEV